MTLLAVLRQGENFADSIKELGLPFFDIDRKFFEALEAEIYFAEFHHFESFFGLLLAAFQALPHWLYLTTYKTEEIKNKVSYLLSNDIEKLTNGTLTNLNDFINQAIYTNCYPPEESKQAQWQVNIDNILWLLQRLGKRYLEAKEYNGYKHGLRVMTGHTALYMYPDGEPEQASGISSEHSLFFLETSDIGNGNFAVLSTTKHFNLDLSINHIIALKKMTSTIKSTRLATLKREAKVDNIHAFFDLHKATLINAEVVTKWSFPV